MSSASLWAMFIQSGLWGPVCGSLYGKYSNVLVKTILGFILNTRNVAQTLNSITIFSPSFCELTWFLHFLTRWWVNPNGIGQQDPQPFHSIDFLKSYGFQSNWRLMKNLSNTLQEASFRILNEFYHRGSWTVSKYVL